MISSPPKLSFRSCIPSRDGPHEPILHRTPNQTQGDRIPSLLPRSVPPLLPHPLPSPLPIYNLIRPCPVIQDEPESRTKKRRDVSARARGIFRLAETVPETWQGEGAEAASLTVRRPTTRLCSTLTGRGKGTDQGSYGSGPAANEGGV